MVIPRRRDGRDQAGDGDHEAGGAVADVQTVGDAREQADGQEFRGDDDEGAERHGKDRDPLAEGCVLAVRRIIGVTVRH
ncbi:MAG: hypothetical protein WDO13_13905, partial [Verrucomicrobiota bacterium]